MADATITDRRMGTAWRIAIVLAGTVAIWSLMAWTSLEVFGGAVTPASRVVNAVLVFSLAVPLVVVARLVLDRRPWRGLALQGAREAWRPLAIGAASFLVPSAIGLTVAQLTGGVRITTSLTPIELAGAIAFTILTVLLLEAVPEELIFRGYVFRNLSASLAPIVAVIVQAILFTVFGTALWVLTTGWQVLVERGGMFLAMGIVLGVLRVLSGSVWNPIGFHLGFQVVAQTLLVQPGVEVSDRGAVTLWGIVVGFVFAATITTMATRRRPNWTRPEPDAPAPSNPTA